MTEPDAAAAAAALRAALADALGDDAAETRHAEITAKLRAALGYCHAIPDPANRALSSALAEVLLVANGWAGRLVGADQPRTGPAAATTLDVGEALDAVMSAIERGIAQGPRS